MIIRDFTNLKIGKKFFEGELPREIQKCLHCGKNGLAELVSGKMFFTHIQWWGFDQEIPEIGWEWCPRPEGQTPVIKHSRQ